VRQINCYIPIKLCITGRLSDAQLEQLAETLMRALAARISFAERTIAQRQGGYAASHAVVGGYAHWEPDRFDSTADHYIVASYQGPPGKAGVKVRLGARASAVLGKVRKIEIYVANKIVRVLLEGDRPPLLFATPELSDVLKAKVGAVIQWGWKNGSHRLSVDKDEIVIRIRGLKTDIDVFNQMIAKAPAPVSAAIYASIAQPNPTPPAAGGGAPEGEAAEPLEGDEGVMAGNGPLAQMFIDFLARYAGLKADRNQAANGLTREQVKNIIGTNAQAQSVANYFTQGWKEYRVIGGSDVTAFGFLEETLLTQRSRGNFTALHNLLEINKAPDGLGLYRRRTPFKYYDEFGQPVSAVGGGYRDSGFRPATPPSFALQIPITDRGLLQVFQAIKNVALDEQILIYNAANGYVDNGDLLWPAVRNGWNGWAAVNEELKRQMPILVAFLGGHLVAMILEKSSDPKAKLIGATINLILKALGRVFQIVFAGELTMLAYSCGRELSLIQREEGKPLDALSQQHLNRAAVAMRQLLTMAIAAGLTAAMLETARQTAITLTPPKGGGLVPAPAGAAPAGGPKAGATTAAGSLPRPPYGIPAPPSQMQMQGEGGGGKGAEKKESSAGEQKKETGPQQEKRLLDEDRPGRSPKGPEYFDWEGGQRGSFRGFVKQLRAHIKTLTAGGDPLPKLSESVLDQNTETFIKSRTNLNKTWEGWTERIAKQMIENRQQWRAAQGDRRLQADLDARYKKLGADKIELESFAKGDVGTKRPDLIEVFFKKDRAVVTDITQKVGDPVHNFKTRFYIEVIKALTGWTDVGGLEYNSPGDQKVIE
jgi:hypothetical protein